MFHHFKIMKSIISLIFTFIFLSNSFCFADRIKDMASLAGVRSNQNFAATVRDSSSAVLPRRERMCSCGVSVSFWRLQWPL